jgi:hypothetical protein
MRPRTPKTIATQLNIRSVYPNSVFRKEYCTAYLPRSMRYSKNTTLASLWNIVYLARTRNVRNGLSEPWWNGTRRETSSDSGRTKMQQRKYATEVPNAIMKQVVTLTVVPMNGQMHTARVAHANSMPKHQARFDGGTVSLRKERRTEVASKEARMPRPK